MAVLRSSMDQAARKVRTRVGLAILGKEFAPSHQSRLFHSDIGKQWFVLGCEYNTRMKIEVQLTLHRVVKGTKTDPL